MCFSLILPFTSQEQTFLQSSVIVVDFLMMVYAMQLGLSTMTSQCRTRILFFLKLPMAVGLGLRSWNLLTFQMVSCKYSFGDRDFQPSLAQMAQAKLIATPLTP